MAEGKLAGQFLKLAQLAGIPEKMFHPIMDLMLSKSDAIEKLVAASFLNDSTKRHYWQSYQGRIKLLAKA